MHAKCISHRARVQVAQTVAYPKTGRYSLTVAANSAIGLGRPKSKRRNSAPIQIAGAFFASAFPFYGGCAWEAFGPAGFLLPRSTNPRTAATLIRLVANGGSSPAKGALHARPQSVKKSRRCPSCNGSRRFTRQLQPRYTPCPLQRSHDQGSRPRNHRGCPMSNALSFSLPEDLLCVNPTADAGIPIDAITCAVDRASSVLLLLEDQFENDGPSLANHIIAAALWDVRGTLGLIRTLALHADELVRGPAQGGGL